MPWVLIAKVREQVTLSQRQPLLGPHPFPFLLQHLMFAQDFSEQNQFNILDPDIVSFIL